MENLKKKADKLRADGIKLYSISRLNAYRDCNYSYFNTYIKDNRGIGNIYSTLGSDIHSILEEIYNNKADKKQLIDKLNDSLLTAELMGITFPTEVIKNNWVKDMTHYVLNFEKDVVKCETETYFLYEILDGIWFNGYIDIFTFNEDGSINIWDYKTSSEFKKADLYKYGRQIVIYKLALEHMGYKVNKCGWDMLKYVHIDINNNGKITSTVANRGKWVTKLQAKLNKFLLNHGYDTFEASLIMEEAIKNNNIDKFPKEIKDMFTFSNHLLEYEVSETEIVECKKFIQESVDKINSKSSIEEDWEGLEVTDKNSFFCVHLCNSRLHCKYLKAYYALKDFGNKKDNAVDNFDSLFK